MATCTLGFIQ